jgi:hypothetical protein
VRPWPADIGGRPWHDLGITLTSAGQGGLVQRSGQVDERVDRPPAGLLGPADVVASDRADPGAAGRADGQDLDHLPPGVERIESGRPDDIAGPEIVDPDRGTDPGRAEVIVVVVHGFVLSMNPTSGGQANWHEGESSSKGAQHGNHARPLGKIESYDASRSSASASQ